LSNSNVSIPQGTRDFGPTESFRRTYIFDTLRNLFKLYGYAPLETPSMENLSTLTGKYGEEGDQLIYKILNSGDFMSKVDPTTRTQISSKSIIPLISERALRYDLTVPFARYVAMNHQDIKYPFKRYQIQPVWRADRPQKGRYREFYQCDVDLVGSSSLLNEADLIQIYIRAFISLGIKDFTIRVNNRKLLLGMAELTSKPEDFMSMVISIDKLDKIGEEGVQKELREKGFKEEDLEVLSPFFRLEGSSEQKLEFIREKLFHTEQGKLGILEMQELWSLLRYSPQFSSYINLDILLARGLNYYTGTIMEVLSPHAKGSLGGGGRYDDLTGIFGLKGITGVGISFGADRIYDLMKDMDLFPKEPVSTQVFIGNFYPEAQQKAYETSIWIRELGISTEIYPDLTKLPKQLKYAAQREIPWVILLGEEEFLDGTYSLKDMNKGEQKRMDLEGLKKFLTENLVR